MGQVAVVHGEAGGEAGPQAAAQAGLAPDALAHHQHGVVERALGALRHRVHPDHKDDVHDDLRGQERGGAAMSEGRRSATELAGSRCGETHLKDSQDHVTHKDGEVEAASARQPRPRKTPHQEAQREQEGGGRHGHHGRLGRLWRHVGASVTVITRVGPHGAVRISVHVPHQRGGHTGEDDEAHEGRRRVEGFDQTGRREPAVEVLHALGGVGGGTVTVLGILGPRGVNAGCRVEGWGGGTVGWAVDWGAVVIAMVIHGVEGHSW